MTTRMEERLNDLSERIELIESMIAIESSKSLDVELKELYSKVMEIAINMV